MSIDIHGEVAVGRRELVELVEVKVVVGDDDEAAGKAALFGVVHDEVGQEGLAASRMAFSGSSDR